MFKAEDVVTALTTGVECAIQTVGFVGTEVTGVVWTCETKDPVVGVIWGSHIVEAGILALTLSLNDW